MPQVPQGVGAFFRSNYEALGGFGGIPLGSTLEFFEVFMPELKSMALNGWPEKSACTVRYAAFPVTL